MKGNVPASIDEYLEGIESDDARSALQRLRKIIREEVPGATECISYEIPTFKFNKTIVCIAAYKKHCSFFPGHTVRDFLDELKDFKTSKGTIQFQPDKPIPEPLVRAILRARYFEN